MWRKSRWVRLLCPWVKHLKEFFHLHGQTDGDGEMTTDRGVLD